MCKLKDLEYSGHHPNPCPKCNPLGSDNMAFLQYSDIHIDEGDSDFYIFCADCGYEKKEM